MTRLAWAAGSSSSSWNSRQQRLSSLLLEAERSIRLIDRLTPVNLTSERARLFAIFAVGHFSAPEFEYERGPDLSSLRHQMDTIATELEGGGVMDRLLGERARELSEEAALVAALGLPEFRRLAEARFRADPVAASDALCARWLVDPPPEASHPLIPSDDVTAPESLLSRLNALISERKLEVRVELRPGLTSIAAAGDGFVAIRPGVALPAEEAERIARHELEAHVLPRLSARKERAAVFRVGCRGAGEQEEGRALLIEERSGLLTRARRFELAARHRACVILRAGGEFAELVSNLCRLGSTLKRAIEVGTRVLRGGGLAREIVYLPAYLQVREAFIARPELERYFERGRISLEAARILFDAEDALG